MCLYCVCVLAVGGYPALPSRCVVVRFPRHCYAEKKEDAKCPRYEILWLFVISVEGNFVICQYRCLFVISIVGFFFFLQVGEVSPLYVV